MAFFDIFRRRAQKKPDQKWTPHSYPAAREAVKNRQRHNQNQIDQRRHAEEDDGDLATSMAIGMATGDPMLAAVVGGDLVGGMLGASMSNSLSSGDGVQSSPACDPDPSPSFDTDSGSSDSGGGDCGGCCDC